MYPLGDCRPIYWRTSWYISISAALLADAWSTLDQLDRPMRGPSPEFQALSVNLLLSSAVSSGGFSSKFQVKFICLLFLPSSLPSIIELCSFCHGWKDLFLLHKLDEMLKQITSQAVEGMWIRTGGYGQFRGKWVKFIVFIFKYIFLISFFSMCRLDQLTHIALWNLKPGNQLNRLYLQ